MVMGEPSKSLSAQTTGRLLVDIFGGWVLGEWPPISLTLLGQMAFWSTAAASRDWGSAIPTGSYRNDVR